MKKTLRWILLVWTIVTIPYVFDVSDFATFFFGLLYAGLILGLTISDLRNEK